MSGWRSILCATGLGDGCRIAVEQAAAIAGVSGARLTLLHVLPTGPYPPWSNLGLSPGGAHDAERALEHQRVAAERLCGGPVSAGLRKGPVVGEVLRALQESPFDLLVIGARRRASLGWLVVGAVASRLVREASCPVLVARPAEGAGPELSAPAEYGTPA